MSKENTTASMLKYSLNRPLQEYIYTYIKKSSISTSVSHVSYMLYVKSRFAIYSIVDPKKCVLLPGDVLWDGWRPASHCHLFSLSTVCILLLLCISAQ